MLAKSKPARVRPELRQVRQRQVCCACFLEWAPLHAVPCPFCGEQFQRSLWAEKQDWFGELGVHLYLRHPGWWKEHDETIGTGTCQLCQTSMPEVTPGNHCTNVLGHHLRTYHLDDLAQYDALVYLAVIGEP